MPPRYSYWTIIAGGLPTAFRAAEKDELLPTFARIKQKHPDAEMKWFARGKLWDSPESARATNRRTDEPASQRSTPSRGREWRPGGEHRDPRQKYRDAKTARNAERRKQKFQRKRQFDRPAETPVGRQPSKKPFRPRSGPSSPGAHERSRPAARTDRPNRGPERQDADKRTPSPRSKDRGTTALPPPRGPRRGPDQHRRRNR